MYGGDSTVRIDTTEKLASARQGPPKEQQCRLRTHTAVALETAKHVDLM